MQSFSNSRNQNKTFRLSPDPFDPRQSSDRFGDPWASTRTKAVARVVPRVCNWLRRKYSMEETIRICGFGVKVQGTRYVRVDNVTGAERDLSAAEGNLWAHVWQAVGKGPE